MNRLRSLLRFVLLELGILVMFLEAALFLRAGRGVALGDFNGDGRLDVFVANLRLVDGSQNPPVFGGSPAEVWINTATPGDRDR